jgi:photosystem II stability/assembly factor-like uncharacterized protein
MKGLIMRIRRVSLFLVLMSVSSAFAQSWQWQNPQISGNYIHSMGSFGGSSVWASSGGGEMLWSSDAGQNWSIRCRTGGPKTKTVFPDELHGFGITTETWLDDTNRACILATTDGGFTWEARDAFPHMGTGLSDINFADAQNGWVISDAQLLHTSDSGETWTDQAPDSIYPTCITSVSTQEGWFVGHRYDRGDSLYHTTDAGAIWTVIPSACPTHCYPRFLDSNHGWATGSAGIAHTTDGGITWSAAGLASNNLTDFCCVNDNTVFAVTLDGKIFETMDAGEHWSMQQPDSLLELDAVHASGEQHLWAAGYWGKIFYSSDRGSEWTLQNGNSLLGTNLQAVDFSDLRHGWAVGNYASTGAVHTSDGGMTWAIQDSGHAGLSVTAVDSLTAWVVIGDVWDRTGALRHTTDGGTSWNTVQPVQRLNIYYVTHFGANDVWAVSLGAYNGGCSWSDSATCHSSNGGATWTCYPIEEDGWVTMDMDFVDPLHGWRICASSGEGNAGAIFRTGDGGQTWEQQYTQGYLGDLEQVSFVDTLHGWAAGNYGGVIRTTNGGITWDTLSLRRAEGWGMTGVQFFDPLNGWAFSRLGYAYRSYDGGLTWSTMFIARVSVSAIDFVDLDHGWMVGDHGSILYYSATSASAPHRGSAPVHDLTLSAYPNPFNPNTTLSFDVPVNSRVRISVYDITGRLVQTLADQIYTQGSHRIEFDGSELPSGIYFARLQGNNFSKTQKLVLLK